MLTDEEIYRIAQTYVKNNDPPDCEILSKEKINDPFGIYFTANKRTEDLLQIYVGDGGFFVDGVTGEVFSLGSGHLVKEGLDYWLQYYKEGYRIGLYRLIITKVIKS